MFLNNLVIAESFQDISLLDRRQIQSPLFFSNHLISRDMILIPPCSLFFSPQISPEMCVYLFLMLLLPYHTFQFGTFDTNMLEHFAAAPKLESQKANGRGKRRERETPSDFPTVDACVLGVTLFNNLLPILQLGCTFRTLQTMKTAGFVQPNCQSLLCCRWWKYQTSEPWVDISIWISSAQLNHSRPPTDNSCNIHFH